MEIPRSWRLLLRVKKVKGAPGEVIDVLGLLISAIWLKPYLFV